MSDMREIRIVDVTDEPGFLLVPPCADAAFDHRTCDYWEDADRGSKAHRSSWLKPAEPVARNSSERSPTTAANPFAPPPRPSAANPFAPPERPTFNPFTLDDTSADAPIENPFAPKRASQPTVGSDAPRKLALLARGLRVFGSYAKVLVADGEPAAYVQFGPLSAYPRALRLRELYPQLPEAPLPAVITCIATTAEARNEGLAAHLVRAVTDDLANRGFSAIEAYPEAHAEPDATSTANPSFWEAAGFTRVVDDDRFPVYRLELGH